TRPIVSAGWNRGALWLRGRDTLRRSGVTREIGKFAASLADERPASEPPLRNPGQRSTAVRAEQETLGSPFHRTGAPADAPCSVRTVAQRYGAGGAGDRSTACASQRPNKSERLPRR